MHREISLRYHDRFGIPETTVRRFQVAVWGIVYLLAAGLSLRMWPQLLQDSIELADMNLSPAEQETFRQHLERLGISVRTLAWIGLLWAVVQNVALTLISATLLLKRRGTDWFAFYLSLTMIAGIGAIYPPSLDRLVDGEMFWLIVGKVLTGLAITSLFLIPLLFPTGRFVPRWMILPAGLIAFGVLSFVIAPGENAGGGTSPTVEAIINVGIVALIGGSIVYRYIRHSTIIQRQQMKWGAVGAVVAVPAFLLGDALKRSIDGSLVGVLSMIGWSVAMPIAALVFPVCLTGAILRFRLFDIDLFLSRTLVWVFMTALVVAAYVGIVFGIGALFTGDQTTILTLVALGVTAVLFQPVRQRVQRGLDRWLFGERDDPYQVVRKLTGDLAETVQPVEALRSTVRTLTDALRLPYAAITLEPGAPPVAAAGVPGSAEVPIPLVYQSRPVGELIVSPRTGSREFDAADRQLLEELAQQIGVVAHSVRLTNDLQVSRERIVTAREEERRRLRRDLHDGLGAQLAGMSLQVGAMKSFIRTDPDAAVEQATELQQELRVAVADIRRLVQGLRPAALDDLGLIGALRTRVATVNLGEQADAEQRLRVALNAPDDLGPLPAAVEVASYRIVDEALTNVVRHAQASVCTITIDRLTDALLLTIEDDGIGIEPNRVSGVGLQSMQERAVELGGSVSIEAAEPRGTRIVAELPA